MKRSLIALAAMAAIAAPSAAAQAVIIGGGMAKDCFLAVEAQSSRFAQVERTCTTALEQETMTRTNRAATYVNRGIIRMRSGKHAQSIGDYDRALELDGDLGPAWLNRGAAYILMGDHANALESLNTAIELESQDLYAAHYNRALAHERLGDVTSAYYDFLKASELRPEWDKPRTQLARFTVTGG